MNQSPDKLPHSGRKTERRDLLKKIAGGCIAAAMLPFFPAEARAERSRNTEQTTQHPPRRTSTGFFALSRSRRSHRAFQQHTIPAADLHLILEAGMNAPSANNSKPWRFVLLEGKEMYEPIINFLPALSYINNAAAVIVTCLDNSAKAEYIPLIQSMSCCCMSIYLAATDLGYGSSWVSITPDQRRMKFFSQMLELPENIDAFNLMPVGIPENHLPEKYSYDKDRIHYGKW